MKDKIAGYAGEIEIKANPKGNTPDLRIHYTGYDEKSFRDFPLFTLLYVELLSLVQSNLERKIN